VYYNIQVFLMSNPLVMVRPGLTLLL